MSSFPQHNDNVKALENIGFDMKQHMEGGEATMDSWGYDDLVDIIKNIVSEMERQGFKAKGIIPNLTHTLGD